MLKLMNQGSAKVYLSLRSIYYFKLKTKILFE
jgi:hypothetical protein